MRLIGEWFNEAELAKHRDVKAFVLERNDSIREVWILGTFVKKFNLLFSDQIVYAERFPQKSEARPDFRVFDKEKRWMFDIEIAECHGLESRSFGSLIKRPIKQEYKCGQKYSRAYSFDDGRNIEYIQEIIDSKCCKGYPRQTMLIIFLNIFLPVDRSLLHLPHSSRSIFAVYMLHGKKIFKIDNLQGGGE